MNNIREFAGTLPAEIMQYGSSSNHSDSMKMRAGRLAMLFSEGSLRYISCGNIEIIRMIYAAVRDRNWLTVKPVIKVKNIDRTENSFSVDMNCIYQSDEINFCSDYLIRGGADNTISFEMKGIVLETSVRNRIGLCVLHPVEGGKGCVIEHTDGSREQTGFPSEISALQVFRNIKSMSWKSGSASCRIDFEGDVFETEDQRNWSDASFKTYSTPLSLPYPVTLEKGTAVFQKITFRAEGNFDEADEPAGTIQVKIFPEVTYRLPSIGICQSGRPAPLSKKEIKLLRSIKFDHYRADLHLYGTEWQLKANQASVESSDLGYPLELALFTDDCAPGQIKEFMRWYEEKRPSVSSLLLYHKSLPVTPDHIAMEIIPMLRESNPGIRIATGTNANFAQINRNRPGETGNDNICYSVHPQEHASDNLTLVENLAAQSCTVESARVFAEEKGIIVTPVTIQRRFNANSSLYELHRTGQEMPLQVDSRIMSLFGACWTLGSIKYLSGAESITYYETAGERGIMQGETDSRWPSSFHSTRGMLFPVWYVFRFVLACKSLNAVKSVSSHPLKVECLALTDGKQGKLIMVNFTDSILPVTLDCCAGLFRNRTLDISSYADAVSDSRWTGNEREKIVQSLTTFKLEPCSVNFIEGWLRH
ncbi:MAG: hypothetical protein V1903_02975 [Bacteroidota bacterium]